MNVLTSVMEMGLLGVILITLEIILINVFSILYHFENVAVLIILDANASIGLCLVPKAHFQYCFCTNNT